MDELDEYEEADGDDAVDKEDGVELETDEEADWTQSWPRSKRSWHSPQRVTILGRVSM